MTGGSGDGRAEGGLEVRGGAGSVVVDADRLHDRGDVLASVAGDLLARAAAAALAGLDVDLAVAGALDPVGAARVHATLVAAVAGRDGLLPVAGELAELAAGMHVAAVAYEVADASAREVVGWVWQHVAGSVVSRGLRGVLLLAGSGAGVVVGGVVVGAVTVVVVGTATWVGFRTWPVAVDVVGDTVSDALTGDLDAGSLDDRARDAVARVGDALGDDVAAAGLHAGVLAASHPWLTEQLLTTPVDLLGSVAVGPARAWDASTRTTGLPRTPDDLQDVAAWLVLGATATGAVRQGTVAVRPAVGVHAVPTPTGTADLFARLAPATPHAAAGSGYEPQRVRVERTVRPGAAPAWTVFVPPTQTWSTDGGPNPFDGSSNLVGFAGERADAGEAVLDVMRSAGIGADEPVLLVGYSQGGITAAQLAADPTVRQEFSVSTLMTVGSPVALLDLPADVQTLSVQHEQDLVAVLDGESNPRRETWTTVTRELDDAVLAGDPWAPHRYEPYAATVALVDTSDDPSLRAWRAAAAPFLAGDDAAATTAAEWSVERR